MGKFSKNKQLVSIVQLLNKIFIELYLYDISIIVLTPANYWQFLPISGISTTIQGTDQHLIFPSKYKTELE